MSLGRGKCRIERRVIWRQGANERQRVSHASGAGQWGPASEREGGAGGAKPPGRS